MEEEEPCNLGLSLQLCPTEFLPRDDRKERSKCTVQFHQLFPPRLKEEVVEVDHHLDRMSSKRKGDEENCRSYINNNSDQTSNIDENGSRKKLRLSKEQSTLLEDSFKEHNTLNSTQKEDLAKRLNLKPRQVEVWFQNRRARIKVKQTEVDYEFMKKYCENLRDENIMLKAQLQELRSTTMPISSPFYSSCTKEASLTLCSLCNKISKETNATVIEVPEKPNLYGGFDESSLTC